MSREPANDPTQLDQRIAQLETMYLHLQRDFLTLDEVVTQQAGVMERLSRRLDQLLGRLDQVESHVEDHRDPLQEKPPHY